MVPFSLKATQMKGTTRYVALKQGVTERGSIGCVRLGNGKIMKADRMIFCHRLMWRPAIGPISLNLKGIKLDLINQEKGNR